MEGSLLRLCACFALTALGALGCGGSATSPCTSARDCSGATPACDPGTHTCVACVRTSDCAATAGAVCIARACAPAVSCVSSRMCPGAVCDTMVGHCVECVSATDCAAGEVCDVGTCGAPPAACTTDRQCSAAGQVCDVAAGHCVDCVRNGDCTPGLLCGADHRCAIPVDLGTSADLGVDAPATELGVDVDLGPNDLGPDDLGIDAPATDLGADAGLDLGTDAGVDLGTDAGLDLGADTGVDLGTDAGAVGADADTADGGFDLGTDLGPGLDGGPPTDAGGCADTVATTCATAISLPALGPTGGTVSATGTVPAGLDRWIALSFPAPSARGLGGGPHVAVAPATYFVMELRSSCTSGTDLQCNVESVPTTATDDFTFNDTNTTDTSDLTAWPSTIYVRITNRAAAPVCAAFLLTVTR